VDPGVAGRLERAHGRRPSVEDVAWYAFGILSAPSYRSRFGAALSIDHPRIPLTEDAGAFGRMAALGRELGQAHLLEASVSSDIRFVGEGDGIVDDVRYDAEIESVLVNGTQAFTGVRPDAWARGQGFRPLEHYLDDRQGRRLDAEQIAGFQAASTPSANASASSRRSMPNSMASSTRLRDPEGPRPMGLKHPTPSPHRQVSSGSA
jgi:hypothetical protein